MSAAERNPDPSWFVPEAASEPATQPKIGDYAMIGDGRSIALVSRAGSIDWLCWPRFESPPVFARLLDIERGGAWSLAPTSPARSSRRYIAGTNVLETSFEMAGGACTVVDAMTIASERDKTQVLVPDHEILRHVRCDRGVVELAVRVAPRPDFGRRRMRVRHHERLGIRWQFGSRLLVLRAELPLVLDDDGVAHGTLRLRAGETASLSLVFDEEGPGLLPPLGRAADERITRSIDWWQRWIARARYDGPYREQVMRSALAVKLMAFAPSGAIVAAPTTSLPEAPGGGLNWDYRYCWLRDAAFTARAFLRLGYLDDAEAFCSWLLHTTRRTQPELHVLYDVYGNAPGDEHLRADVRGYRDARPVRIGNAAFSQRQLDCHGEVIDAVAQLALATGELDRDTRKLLRELGGYVCEHWSEPDHGIWEARATPAHHTHSRLMCWVALERLLELGDRGLVDRIDFARFAQTRDAIRADIEARAFVDDIGCYSGTLDDRVLDASALLLSFYGFHGGDHPRMRSTFARIRERLGAGDGLFYRYEASIERGEGAFALCSFWAVEHLAHGGGSVDEAHAMMRAACAYANDVGLMAEQVEPRTGDALGNFPQAYTHVGLLCAAHSLEAVR